MKTSDLFYLFYRWNDWSQHVIFSSMPWLSSWADFNESSLDWPFDGLSESSMSQNTEIPHSTFETQELMTQIFISELNSIFSQLISLKTEISNLQFTLTLSLTSMTFSVKELKGNEIFKYDGNSEHLDEFLNVINIRFMLQLNEYTLNHNKVLTVLEHLEGQVRTWALSISQFKRSDLISDWELFLKQFIWAFQDWHTQKRLIQKLQALKQIISMFNYVINFEALCNRVNWPIDVWADQFYQGLKESIKNTITYFSVSLSDYEKLKEQAQWMNQWIMRCNAEALTWAMTSHLSNCASAASAVYTSALSRSAVASAACASVSDPSAPWSLYAAFFSLHDPLTDNEKAYHRAHHLCLYCSKSEHIVNICLIWPSPQTLTVMYSDHYLKSPVVSEAVSPWIIILEFYPLTLSVSNSVLEKRHLIIQGAFRWGTVQMMMNSGVTVNFVNVSWLSSFAWKSVLKLSLEICVLDRRTIILKNESKVCTFDIMIDQLPLIKLSAITASCVNYDVILETPWLHAVNSDIDWKLWTMTLRIIWEPPLGFVEEPSEASVPSVEPTPVKKPLKLTQTLVAILLKSSVNDHLKQNQALVKFTLKSPVHDHLKTHSDLVKISLKVLEDPEDYVLDLNAVDYADYLDDEFSFLMYSHCLTEEKVTFAATSVSFNAGKPLMTDEDWEVPEVYRKFTDVFFKGKAETLPEFRDLQVDHVIELTPDFKVFNKSAYNHSEKELQVQQNYISENITHDWIQVSKFSVFSSCMFTVKKNIMNLHLIVDYRSLNAVTVKNRYPLPLIDTLLNRLESVKYFTRLDLQNVYHLIRIQKGDEWKTAFKTRYGLYKYTVMPFDLINASVTFQVYIDQVLTEMIDTELIAFLNDILIFDSTQEECWECTLKAL